MAGERFDLDGIVKFGDPWHGIVRGGVIELPNGGTRPPAGTAPLRLTYTWTLGYTSTVDGECYAVKVPGTPAATTSSAEAAAGMTWLDYGILSGRNRRLYGISLGSDSWIYVAPDSSVWMARVSVFSGDGKTLAVALSPVFKSGTVTQTVYATLTSPRADLGTLPWPRIADINSAGSGVVFTSLYTPNDGVGQEFFTFAAELSLAGIPPAATASLAVIYDAAYLANPGGATYTDTTTQTRWIKRADNSVYSESRTFDAATGTPPWPLPSDAADSFGPIVVARAFSTSGPYWIVGAGYDHNDARIWYTINQVITWNTPYDPPSTFGGSGGGYSGTRVNSQTLKAGAFSGPTVTLTMNGAGAGFVSADGYEAIEWTRYTNRAVGLFKHGASVSLTYCGVVSPAALQAFLQTTRPGVSIHPVTGAMIIDLSGSSVCVV